MSTNKWQEIIDKDGFITGIRRKKIFRKDNMKKSKCNDCRAEYGKMGLDLVLPDQQWKILCPEGGILCASCICKRASKLPSSTVIFSWIDRLDYSKPYKKLEK